MSTPRSDASAASEPSPRPSSLDPRRTACATAFEAVGGLLLLFIARTLGAEDFGRYAALMALVTFVQLGAEFGQEPVLVRLLAQRGRGDMQRLVDGAMAMRLAFTTVGGAVLIAVGARLLPIGAATVALAAGGLVATTGAVLRAVFRTEQRLDRLCIVALVNVTTFAAVLAIARAWQLGLAGVVAAWSMGQLGSSLTATALARRMLPVRPRWRTAVTATLARSGWALARREPGAVRSSTTRRC